MGQLRLARPPEGSEHTDLADERYDAPEAPGLDVLLCGLSMIHDDDELLACGVHKHDLAANRRLPSPATQFVHLTRSRQEPSSTDITARHTIAFGANSYPACAARVGPRNDKAWSNLRAKPPLRIATR